MNKRIRKNTPVLEGNKYYTVIQPQLQDIKADVDNDYTIKWICEKYNIDTRTFLKYRRQYSELNDIFVESTRHTSNKVEKSLINLCNGYFVTEEKTITNTYDYQDKDNKSIKIVVKTIHTKHKKYITPQVAAQQTFLYNKDSDNYKDRRYVNANADNTGNKTYSDLLKAFNDSLDNKAVKDKKVVKLVV